MKPLSIIELENNTKKRKEQKKSIDDILKYNQNENDKISMYALSKFSFEEDDILRGVVFSEGVVLNDPIDYIPKGELEKAYNLLDDNFKGILKISHTSYIKNPIVIGEFTKADLSLNKLEDGRCELIVAGHLYNEISAVTDLKVLLDKGYHIGISAEFNHDIDYEMADQIYDEVGIYMRVIRNIKLLDIAVVGSGANVNSNNIEIYNKKGVDMQVEDLKKIVAEYEESDKSLEELDKAVSEETTEEETPEVKKEDTTEEKPVEETTEEEKEKATEEEITEDTTEEKPAEDTTEEKDVLKEVYSLKEELEKTKAEYQVALNTIDTMKKEKAEFLNKFKNIQTATQDTKKEDVSKLSFNELF